MLRARGKRQETREKEQGTRNKVQGTKDEVVNLVLTSYLVLRISYLGSFAFLQSKSPAKINTDQMLVNNFKSII